MCFIYNYLQGIKLMNRVLLFIIPLFPFCCFGQEDGVLPQTTTYIAETSDGYTMSITLYPNGRYDFTTYWMQYHGKYEITVSSYSDFDYIGFYDDNIDFEGYFYYRYDYDTEALSKLYTLDGNDITIRAREELSIAFQHEIDHLNGKVFIDLLSPWKRKDVEKEIRRRKKGGSW